MKVLIADADCQILENLAGWLSQQPEIDVVSCAQSAVEAFPAVDHADIIIAGADLPADGAYQLIRAANGAAQNHRGIPVLVISRIESRDSALRYLETGAQGYLRILDVDEPLAAQIVSALHRMLRGEAVLPPDLACAAVRRLAELAGWLEDSLTLSPEASQSLTRREREVLFLLGRDFSNQDIANYLIIEVGTVKNHVHNILAKLKVNNRREAANLARFYPGRPPINSLHSQSLPQQPWKDSARPYGLRNGRTLQASVI